MFQITYIECLYKYVIGRTKIGEKENKEFNEGKHSNL